MVDNQRDNMRTYASSIAAKAIASHMHRTKFDYKNNSDYKIGMYSTRFDLLYGDDIENADFNKSVYQKEDALYVVDKSAHLHLGIKYIVLENTHVFKDIEKLKKQIIFYTLLILIFISIIGYFLSRLFLKPIADERERLDKFIKDTTHELNTPISALLMSISSLKNEESKVKERIKLSATRISNIYDDLCYLLKDELEQQYEIKTVDIKAVVEEQLLLLEQYAKSKKIRIKLTLEKTFFQMDEESSKRLINNILSNALKYSKPNSDIIITLQNQELKVEDFGVGIKGDSLSKITNRYYRANTSEGGFGIGLDIVDTICKKYNIEFKLRSKENQGTQVILDFVPERK